MIYSGYGIGVDTSTLHDSLPSVDGKHLTLSAWHVTEIHSADVDEHRMRWLAAGRCRLPYTYTVRVVGQCLSGWVCYALESTSHGEPQIHRIPRKAAKARTQSMQAAAKAALNELVRGLSVGAIVRAAAPSCPACAPVLTCEPCRLCPDCICGTGERCLVTSGDQQPTLLLIVIFILGCACCFLSGLILGRRHHSPLVDGRLGRKGSGGVWLGARQSLSDGSKGGSSSSTGQ